MKAELHTSIYASEHGYCCIRQQNGEDEPHLIVISPGYVDDLCEMLQVIKQQALRKQQVSMDRENFLKSQEGE